MEASADYDAWAAPFLAEVTSSSLSSGTYRHAWKEKCVLADGTLADADPGRSGSTTDGWAVELNNRQVSNNTVVWMRLRGAPGGVPFWEFQAPDGSVSGGGGVTVQDDDTSPSYTSITTIQFDQSDGFSLSNPSAGVALVDLLPASASQVGVVSTTTQTFAGDKTFLGTIYAPLVVIESGGATDTARFGWAGSTSGPSFAAGAALTGGGVMDTVFWAGTGNFWIPTGAAFGFKSFSGSSETPGVTTTFDYEKPGGGSGTVTVTGGIITSVT